MGTVLCPRPPLADSLIHRADVIDIEAERCCLKRGQGAKRHEDEGPTQEALTASLLHRHEPPPSPALFTDSFAHPRDRRHGIAISHGETAVVRGEIGIARREEAVLLVCRTRGTHGLTFAQGFVRLRRCRCGRQMLAVSCAGCWRRGSSWSPLTLASR